MTEPLLTVDNLSVSARDGRLLVDRACLTVAAGQIVGLVGESGSGKTTLCRAIAALLSSGLQVCGGRIMLRDNELTAMSAARAHSLRPRGIAMAFQDPLAALNPVMRLGDQIVEAVLARRDVSRAHARDIAVGLFDRMGIDKPARRLHSYPHQLSGGQRQRAMLAVALAADPVLLLADEPTSSVDVFTQKQILDLIADLARERDLAVLLVTHDYGVAAHACARTAVMYGGQIIEEGPTRALLARPAHPYTQLLIDSIPSLRVRRPRLSVIPPPHRKLPSADACPFYPRCAAADPDACVTTYRTLGPSADRHVCACVLSSAAPA